MRAWKAGGGALGHAELSALTDARQIASPEGLKNFCGKYPQTKVVSHAHTVVCVRARVLRAVIQITGWIDQGLNEKAYIIPGLGDFGERR